MQRVEQESARMGVLVEDMLLLARLDQQRPLEHRPVDLLTLAADAVQDARIIAPDRDDRRSTSAPAPRSWCSATRCGCARSSAT